MGPMLVAVPTQGTKGLRDTVSDIFAKAPTFTFIEIVDGKVNEVRVEENEASALKHGTGPIVMKKLKDRGVSMVIASEVGPGAKTLLDISEIRIFNVEPSMRVSEAVNKLIEVHKAGY
jgi:predicted Fe-Mo cluster-binding NifX family protein